MTPEMDNGIEGIDPQPTISSLFLPSVKQVPRGDGFSRQKEWINGSRKAGREVWPGYGPGRVAFSSGQNGGGGSVIDKTLGGETLARPRVDCREDREGNTHAHKLKREHPDRL